MSPAGQPWRSTPHGADCAVRDSGNRLTVWDAESGELHRDLEGFEVSALATFVSADGQQPRLVMGSTSGELRVYDPEAGSVLHRLEGHTRYVPDLACIASSSAAPHHPHVVSASDDRSAKVWDGETGEMLADLRWHEHMVRSVAVWKEHTGGHDRIATLDRTSKVRIWDGEAFTLLHDLDGASAILPFKSAEGPARLLVWPLSKGGAQVWDPEEGRLLHDGINRGCPLDGWHLFESAQGRHLLATVGRGEQHPRHSGNTARAFLDVWDLGEALPCTPSLRGAHHRG
jgi:WD40 repeat protein